MSWISIVQAVGAAVATLLGVLAFLRSGKTEERSAAQSEVDKLWAENRSLRKELGTVRRENREEIAAVRQEAVDREASLRADHERCERELAELRAMMAP